MDITDLKNKTDKDLREILVEKRRTLRELSFQVSEKQLKNVREIRQVRKNIAQILTLLNKNS